VSIIVTKFRLIFPSKYSAELLAFGVGQGGLVAGEVRGAR